MIPSDSAENARFTPPVLTVSALNQAVSRMLERTFPLTWISGEISNFTRAASGHWYFTLKDDAAQVRAVMFRGRAQYADFNPREGDKVEVRALVTLYAARGDYQINVEAIRRAGVGVLYEAFLKLKEKLSAEGLFEPAQKRALPIFASTIGIVTSPQAAALRDILITLKRRAPHVRIILYPTPVQGLGAAEKIAFAINTASARAECQLLLVCRGGGSIEDLWSFNDEGVARAIAACSIPVISGVGHETDFTICDFIADMRAPTPTAAAEMAVSSRDDWMTALESHADDLNRAMKRHMRDATQSLDWTSRRLISPSAYIAHQHLKLRGLHTRLTHAMRTPLAEARYLLMHLHTRCAARLPDTRAQRKHVAENARRILVAMMRCTAKNRQSLNSLAAQLELLNPQRTLERGYAIVLNQHGEIVRNPRQIVAGQHLNITLAQGETQIGVASAQSKLDGM